MVGSNWGGFVETKLMALMRERYPIVAIGGMPCAVERDVLNSCPSPRELWN